MARNGSKDLNRASLCTLRRFLSIGFLLFMIVVLYEVVTSSWGHKAGRQVEAGERRVSPALWHLGEPIPDYKESAKKWWAATNHLRCYLFGLSSSGYRTSALARVGGTKLPGVGRGVDSPVCPSYFQWIYEDLLPWKATGITEKHLAASTSMSAFRVVISNGRLYADYRARCFQSRGHFTLWGLVQLLERYPGQVPDVDLMFHCWDVPNVEKPRHTDPALVPPLFSYCSTDDHWDIPFPDWSFWGWPETNINPWDEQGPEIFDNSNTFRWWENLDNSAYWKGNPVVAVVRREMLKCNASKDAKSKIHLYIQNWSAEVKTKFSTSNLARHCNHRYNIYAPGNAWSVSYKYIMACGAPVIAIESEFYEFFTRSLLPRVHYLLAPRTHLCSSINYQVEWGDKHLTKARKIGVRGQRFMKEDLKLDNVYSYMLHLLTKYSKLLTYVPKVPVHAEEVSRKKLLCVAKPEWRDMMLRGAGSADDGTTHRPCILPAANPKYVKEVTSKRNLLSK